MHEENDVTYRDASRELKKGTAQSLAPEYRGQWDGLRRVTFSLRRLLSALGTGIWDRRSNSGGKRRERKCKN